MSQEKFDFRYGLDEYRRLRRLAFTRPWRMPIVPRAIIIVAGLKFMDAVVRHSLSLPALAVIGLLFALIIAGELWLRNVRFRRLAVEGSLALTEAGFTGSLEGAATAIGWSEIGSVRNLDDTVMIVRRNAAGAIAIPKAQISDFPAFWTFLENRLVNQRGLVRTSFPRTQIVNNLC